MRTDTDQIRRGQFQTVSIHKHQICSTLIGGESLLHLRGLRAAARPRRREQRPLGRGHRRHRLLGGGRGGAARRDRSLHQRTHPTQAQERCECHLMCLYVWTTLLCSALRFFQVIMLT